MSRPESLRVPCLQVWLPRTWFQRSVGAILTIIIVGVAAPCQDHSLAAIESLIRQSKYDDAAAQLQQILAKQPSSARALTLLATLQTKEGNWPEAETLNRRAVATNPKSVEACVSLATLLRDEARWPEAAAQYESCRKLVPSNTKIAAELASVYERAGEYAKSLTAAMSIPAASRPTSLLPVIASDYFATNQPDKASEAVAQVLRHAGEEPSIVPALANSLIDLGMYRDAAELLRITEAHHAARADFLAAEARVQAAGGDTQQARKTFDQAVKMSPKSQSVLAAGASLAIAWKQWDKALEFLDAALSAGPPRSDLLQMVVFVELQKRDLQAAHGIAQRWYTMRPEESASALAFAVVLVEGNHWGEARPLLEKVLTTNPNDKGARLAMGVVQYNAGDLAAAKKYLNGALGGGPDDANAHYFLGLIAKQEGNPSAAVAQLERAVEIQPKNAKALGQLGQLYLQQNELPKARTALEKAIQQAPEEPQNHYELARVYNKLGLKEQSAEQIKLYEQLRPQRPQQPLGEAPPH